MTSWLGPFGPGFFRALGENSKRYFRSFSARWRLKRVDGFNTIAERINRPWRMRSAHKPATMRSETRRFGERFRGRFRIRSCCLRRTDSATTERAPQEIGRASCRERVEISGVGVSLKKKRARRNEGKGIETNEIERQGREG